MTVRPTFPETPLELEQWQQIQDLSRSLTEPQARWVSGYFAGFTAALNRSTAGGDLLASQELPSDARSVTVLYGTETGNSAELARALEAGLRARGIAPVLVDMANYKPRKLKEEQDVLIIVSTYGEGDPPQPAVGFFEFLEGTRAPKLPALRYSVLALGDSTYEFYCEAGKRLDRRLEELGAERLAPRVDCDIDYEEPSAKWSAELVERLAAARSARPVSGAPSSSIFPVASVHDKRNPFAATIMESIPIVGRDSTKETRHLELDLQDSGLSYEPGDAIGIQVANDPQRVEEIVEALRFEPGTAVTLKGESLPLADALEHRLEITNASPRFAEQWAELSGAEELKGLTTDESRSERVAFLAAHHLIDIIRAYPAPGVSADQLIAALRPLQPRLYSIASSLKAVPDEAHITISPVRFELHRSPRTGVASGHICDRLETGSVLPIYIQENVHFRLPSDPSRPIIMIGAGTGVAPYRAFLQEREALGEESNSWLFFGDRNFRSDFLYQLEWQEHLKAGRLTKLDVAFSRDSERKVYVQHRMLEQKAELYRWLQEGAHHYVCGDAEKMAPDVEDALVTIVESEAAVSREKAQEYVSALRSEQRYQRDVY